MPSFLDTLYGASSAPREQTNAPGFMTGVKSGLSQYAVGAGRLLEDFTPFEDTGRAVREYGEGVQRRNPTTVHNFEDFAARPWQGFKEIVGQGLGSTAPALIPYVGPVGRALGTAGAATAGAAASAVPSYGGIRQTQDQEGISDRWSALAGAGTSGAIEQLGGVQRLFRPTAGTVTRGMASTPLRTGLKRAGATALEEGGEELLQNPIEQYAGGQNPADHVGETLFGGFSGALGGLVPFGAASGLRRGMQHAQIAQYVQANLTNPAAPLNNRMEAAELQRGFMTGQVGQQQADAWYAQMRAEIEQDFRGAISSGETFDLLKGQAAAVGMNDEAELPMNPYDLGGHVSALQQGADTTLDSGQAGLFDGGYQAPTSDTGMMAEPAPQTAPAPQAQSFGDQFRASGGLATGVRKALDAAQSPQDAAEVIRATLEKPNIATSTLRAAEAMHKQLTGETYEQFKQKEAANAVQKSAPAQVDVRQQAGDGQAVGVGNAQGQATAAEGQTQGQSQVVPVTVPLGGTNDINRQVVRTGGGQTPAGPVPQVQTQAGQGSRSQATGDSENAGGQTARAVVPQEPGELQQWMLAEIAKRDPKKAVALALHLGWHDGNAHDNADIGKRFGVSKERARQMVKEAAAIMTDVSRKNNLTIKDFTAKEEVQNEDVPAGSQSSFNRVVGEADLAPSQQEEGGERTTKGYSVRSASEVNSDNITGEARVGSDGKIHGNAAPTGDAEANQREKTLTKALETGDVESEAGTVWDAYAHLQSAQGEKVKPWDVLGETEQGAQTKQDFAEFYAKSKTSPVPGAAQGARINKILKGKYYSIRTKGKYISQAGDLQEVDPIHHQALMRALASNIHAGFGPHLQKLETVYVASNETNWNALLVADDTKPTYHLVVSPQLWLDQTSLNAERTFHHELHHVIDDVSQGPRYSWDTELVNGDVRAEIDQKLTEGNKYAKDMFNYPLGKEFADMNFGPEEEAAEIHAQMMSAFMVPRVRRKMAEHLPLTHSYAEMKYAQILADAYAIRKAAKNEGTQQGGETTAAASGSAGGGGRRVGGSISEAASFDVGEAKQRASTTLSDTWAKHKPGLLTLHQITDQFGEKLQSLVHYVASMDKMEARQQTLMQDAHKLILPWQGLHAATRESLDKVMHQATLRGIHPDEPFGPGTANAHVTDQGEYTALKAKYDALPTDAKKIYQDTRALLDKFWKARGEAFDKVTKNAYQQLIDAAAGDAKKVAELTAERDKLIADHAKQLSSIKGPYFPLLRFGDYLTIAESQTLTDARAELEDATGADRRALEKRIDKMKRDGNHYVVEAYSNRYEAEKAKAQYEARGMTARSQLAEQHLRAMQPIAAGAVERISDSISSQFDAQTAGKIKHLITELYITSLPEHAALQRQLKRKGIEGATQDMLRAVAKSTEKDAFYLARMEYSDEITGNLFAVKKEAKKAGINYEHVYNNLAARVALDFEYKPAPIQSFLARLSGYWHLGMSPAYLLTNATQPWMITAPVLAGKFGMGQSLSALRSAWVDAARIIKQSKSGGAFADIDISHVTDPGEKQMLELIVSRGQIDINQNVDMGLVADGTDPKFLKMQKVFGWANQHIEASNRITTGLAAYRLGRQQGMSQEAASQYALKQVVDTQLDYSNANAAYWMKHGAVPLGRLIFQFRKYQQGMLYLMARNAQLAFKGDKDAQRALGYLAATQLAFAGAVGLPVVTAPLAAISMFVGGGDDEKGDAQTQIRNWLTDLMGADAARAFWKGLPTLIGLDISQRVGMGDMWKPLPFLKLDRAKTGQDAMGQTMLNVAGAPFGTLASMWDGLKYWEKGDWQKGTEKMMPKMIADLVKAERYADEGITTRAGATVMKPDQMDGWDIALRAAGFSPTIESEHYAAQQSKEDTAQAIAKSRTNLLAKYAQEKIRGGDIVDEQRAIDEFNAEHGKGFRIDRSAQLRAVETRKKQAKDLDESGVRFKKNEKSLKGIDRFASGA